MSTITVKFFARLKEQTGVAEMTIPAEKIQTLNGLKHYLVSQHPDWEIDLGHPMMAAVNQSMVNNNPDLNAGDEVAFFPPVTGG